jgi:hypothetical protein
VFRYMVTIKGRLLRSAIRQVIRRPSTLIWRITLYGSEWREQRSRVPPRHVAKARGTGELRHATQCRT